MARDAKAGARVGSMAVWPFHPEACNIVADIDVATYGLDEKAESVISREWRAV